jgi:hypothetical protein
MNLSWESAAILVVVVVLVIAGSMWSKTKAFHRNMFWVDEASSIGTAANYEIFALYDYKLGKMVGIALGDADDMQICLDPADAQRLAELLEVSAQSAIGGTVLPNARTN